MFNCSQEKQDLLVKRLKVSSIYCRVSRYNKLCSYFHNKDKHVESGGWHQCLEPLYALTHLGFKGVGISLSFGFSHPLSVVYDVHFV